MGLINYKVFPIDYIKHKRKINPTYKMTITKNINLPKLINLKRNHLSNANSINWLLKYSNWNYITLNYRPN